MTACTRANFAYTTKRVYVQFRAFTCFVLTGCIVRLKRIRYLLSPIISVASENSSGVATANGVDGNVVKKEVIEVQPRNRLSSQFCAVTCFILADYVVVLVGIEFPLLTIMSAASADSSGIAIANGVDGNAVRKEVVGVQASELVVEPVPCIHCFALTDCIVGLVEIEFILLAIISVTSED